VTLVLDSGALIALERDARSMWTRLKSVQLAGELPVTHAGVLGQVWRGGARQARLSQALKGIDVRPLDVPLGREAGQLLGATGLSDIVDASLVVLSTDGDEIITLDRPDFGRLAAASGRHVDLIRP
jgi:hypothetical protein